MLPDTIRLSIQTPGRYSWSPPPSLFLWSLRPFMNIDKPSLLCLMLTPWKIILAVSLTHNPPRGTAQNQCTATSDTKTSPSARRELEVRTFENNGLISVRVLMMMEVRTRVKAVSQQACDAVWKGHFSNSLPDIVKQWQLSSGIMSTQKDMHRPKKTICSKGQPCNTSVIQTPNKRKRDTWGS